MRPDKKLQSRLVVIWSGRRDSNPRHLPWQGSALPLSYSRFSIKSIFILRCAEGQNRTGDTSIFSAVLYRLSYLGPYQAENTSYCRELSVSRNLIESNFFRHRPNTFSNVGAESNQHYSYQSATSQPPVS